VLVWASQQPEQPSTLWSATRTTVGAAWREPAKLALGEDPGVASDPAGDVLAVWTLPTGPSTSEIEAAVLRRGRHAWGRVVELSPGGERAVDPQLALDAQGGAVVAWEAVAGTSSGSPTSVVQARVGAPFAGTWGGTVTLSRGAGRLTSEPALGVTPGGEATIAWQQDGAPVSSLQVSRRSMGSGAWSAPQTIATLGADTEPPGSCAPGPCPMIAGSSPLNADPRLAVAPDGRTVLAWVQPATGDGERIETAERNRRPGGWSSPLVLSDPSASRPEVAIDDGGEATSVWERAPGGGGSLVEADSTG
jgi:hypothetical protein